MKTLNDLLKDESSFIVSEEGIRPIADEFRDSLKRQYFDKKGRRELYKLAFLASFSYIMGFC